MAKYKLLSKCNLPDPFWVDGISIGYVINLLKEEINKINEKV